VVNPEQQVFSHGQEQDIIHTNRTLSMTTSKTAGVNPAKDPRSHAAVQGVSGSVSGVNHEITNTGPRKKGSSPSMQPLVFWPRAGTYGAGAILELCAQLAWCELYDMQD